eukprot:TRINITY_DN6325_c0_g1_i1.p1 TRINITY_DN6325_c0_g1~~TRINITY_DN6325_c0_g1_i1.p1  ORF type:complete len:506 (+),score=26.54 TRINITY_DN6325_c0_g1_i1:71-1519(+)
MDDVDDSDPEDGLSFADAQFTPLPVISSFEAMPNTRENTPLFGAFSHAHYPDFQGIGNLLSSSFHNSGFPQPGVPQMSDRASSMALSGSDTLPSSLGPRRSAEPVFEQRSMQDAVNRQFAPYRDNFDQRLHDESLSCAGVTSHMSSGGQLHAAFGSGGSELNLKFRSQFEQTLQERPSSSEDSTYYAARRGPLDLNPSLEGYQDTRERMSHMSSNLGLSAALPQDAMQNHRSWEAARNALSQKQKRPEATLQYQPPSRSAFPKTDWHAAGVAQQRDYSSFSSRMPGKGEGPLMQPPGIGYDSFVQHAGSGKPSSVPLAGKGNESYGFVPPGKGDESHGRSCKGKGSLMQPPGIGSESFVQHAGRERGSFVQSAGKGKETFMRRSGNDSESFMQPRGKGGDNFVPVVGKGHEAFVRPPADNYVPVPFTAGQPQSPDGVPSMGSIGHPFTCGPACKYALKDKGCKDGYQCDRCHICVWKKVRKR